MASVSHHHPPPNYVNPPTRPPAVQTTCVIYLILVAGSLLLRLYTRVRFGIRLWLDDVFAVSGSAFTVSAYIVMLMMEDRYGFNRHTWDISPTMYRIALKLNWVYTELFVQATCQAKLSLLLFCWRLIGRGSSRVQTLLLIVLSTIVVLCNIAFVIVSVMECIPLKAAWDPHPHYRYTCFHIPYFLLSAGLINTSTDVACLLFPILFVLRQQMPLRQRFAVASVFLLGFSASIASCLRIYFAFRQEMTGDIWDEMQPTIASNSEIGLGLICVNAPVIRPLLTHLLSYRNRYNQIYATSTIRGPYGGAYRLGRTNTDLDYASDMRNLKNDGNDSSSKPAITPIDRGILDREADMEAVAANADSWQVTPMEVEPV